MDDIPVYTKPSKPSSLKKQKKVSTEQQFLESLAKMNAGWVNQIFLVASSVSHFLPPKRNYIYGGKQKVKE